MSDPSVMPWSDNPNAPQIPRLLYLEEKTTFSGVLIGAVFYGIVIVLFFQCMGALLDPINRRRGGIKWGLVVHTVAMFSIVTIYTTITLHIQSLSYIDNREFPGIDGVLPPGPLGYRYLTYSKAISIVPDVMFFLNNWLADGLLLYRCYVIYAMNHWVIAFPSLMYFGSLATGIMYIYRSSRLTDITTAIATINNLGIPHHSISLSLNVLLTVMIAARLILHSRNFRSLMGPSATADGLYKTVVAVLTESCALFAVSFVLFVGPWAAKSPVANVFFPLLVQTQVIAPFLVILRVANRSSSTSKTIVYGGASSIDFTTQRKAASGSGTLPGSLPTSSVDTCVEAPGRPEGRAEIVINLHHDS